MVHLLLEDYASKRNKILKDPKFLELYGKYTSGIFGGARHLTKETFIDNIAKSFDPLYNVTVNPQTGALNGDSKYLDFIMTNLYSGNITPDQAPAVHETLKAYHKKAASNAPGISKDLQSYKIFYPDDNIVDRQGEPLPGLVKAMEEFTRKYDFEEAIHPNLLKTIAAFEENDADEVYSNSMYRFFRINTIEAAKNLLGNRDPAKDPDFFTSGRSERCSGYWCLPHMSSYFPCWVAVDVYGFMDYAIVSKPGAGYVNAEIKNRFNHQDSVCKMSPASYDAILDFFLSQGESDPRIVAPFKKYKQTIGLRNAFLKFSKLEYDLLYEDYIKFMVRLPNLDVVRKLTDETFASDVMYAASLAGLPNDKMATPIVYDQRVGLGLADLRNYYAGKKIRSFAPIFKSLEQMHGISLTETDFSFNKYAAIFIPSLINKFKQAFPQDTDLLANEAQGFTKLYDFMSTTLPVIDQYKPELAKKIATQIAKLLEEDRLYFDATVSITTLLNALKHLNSLKQLAASKANSFEQFEQAVNTLESSFSYYMNMGGAFNWDDPQGTVAKNPALLDKLADYIENSTIENKQKLFDLYAQSITNSLANNDQGNPLEAYTITGLFNIAAKLNLPRETGIKKVVDSLDKSIIKKPTAAVTSSVRQIMNNDEIASYINRNKKYINKVAPHLAQLLAIIDPSSEFGVIYPKIAKIKLNQKYVIADKRRSFFNELKSLSNGILTSNRPELAFGNNDSLRNSMKDTFMVPATAENIQKMISLRGNGYSSVDFQQMLPNLAMLINAGFKPVHLFINFGNLTTVGVMSAMNRKGFALAGNTLIKGELNGKPVGINASGVIYYLDGNTLRGTESFGEFQQHQQQALFDHYKPKPKHGFFGLYERVNSLTIK